MEIYLVTNGTYDETVVIGVAASHKEAQTLVTKAQAEYPGEFLAEFGIDGPFEPGQLYGRLGGKL